MDGGIRSVPGVVLLAAVAGGAVAVGAAGVGLLVPPGNADASWLQAARIGGTVAAALGLVGLYVMRHRLQPPGARGPDPTVGALLAATTIMAVLTVLALLAPVVGLREGAGREAPTTGEAAIDPDAPGRPPPPSRTAPLTEGAEFDQSAAEPEWQELSEGPEIPAPGGFDWNLLHRVLDALLPVFLLAALVIGFLALSGRLRRRGPPGDDAGDLAAADAEAGLEASLGAVEREAGDPRRQITLAYRRLLAALTAAGAPRRPYEAPHEHLHRVLGPLGVRPGPMHDLTALHVVAQFSPHPLTDDHRASAAEALERGLAGLRAAREPVEVAAPVGPEPATA